jgi:hypothetical protein
MDRGGVPSVCTISIVSKGRRVCNDGLADERTYAFLRRGFGSLLLSTMCFEGLKGAELKAVVGSADTSKTC